MGGKNSLAWGKKNSIKNRFLSMNSRGEKAFVLLGRARPSAKRSKKVVSGINADEKEPAKEKSIRRNKGKNSEKEKRG